MKHTREVLLFYLNGLDNVTHWKPLVWNSPEFDVKYHQVEQFLQCRKKGKHGFINSRGTDGSKVAHGVRVFLEEKQMPKLDEQERKVISNMLSFIDILHSFAAEPQSVSDENDWLLIFEDDITVHPGTKEPTCDILQVLFS